MVKSATFQDFKTTIQDYLWKLENSKYTPITNTETGVDDEITALELSITEQLPHANLYALTESGSLLACTCPSATASVLAKLIYTKSVQCWAIFNFTLPPSGVGTITTSSQTSESTYI